MRFNKKNLIFWVFTIMLIIFTIEISGHIISVLFIKKSENKTLPIIKDKQLGLRLNPSYPGHDSNGYRNKFIPNKADIITMGDSQTYGVGVSLDETWPQKLKKLSKLKTYNMACGGYGPVHNLILLNETNNLEPKLVILTFYAGNDLYDSYSIVYNNMQFPEFRTVDQSIANAVFEAENNEPFSELILRVGVGEDVENHILTFKKFLAEHSKLYGMLQIIKFTILKHLYGSEDYFWRLNKKIMTAEKSNEYREIFDNGKFKTIFTSKYRLCAINLNDPRISEGFRMSLKAIYLINKQLKNEDVEFIVLLIPTKEMVFKDVFYQTSSDIPGVYKALIESEELFWNKSKVFLRNEGIKFIDTLPTLRKSIQDGNQPYGVSEDGHPNHIGHNVIAELVYSKIKNYNF